MQSLGASPQPYASLKREPFVAKMGSLQTPEARLFYQVTSLRE